MFTKVHGPLRDLPKLLDALEIMDAALKYYSNQFNWEEKHIGSIMNPQTLKKIDHDNGRVSIEAQAKVESLFEDKDEENN